MKGVSAYGAFTDDLGPDGSREGGSVYYARAVYQMFGARWQVTSPHHRFRFMNRYQDGVRTQRCAFVETDPMRPSWHPVVHLMPVMSEVALDDDWVNAKPKGATLALNAQGFLRGYGPGGEFRDVVPVTRTFPKGVDLLFFSQEDVVNVEQFVAQHADVKTLVETRGDAGAIIRTPRETIAVDALPSDVIDPTGAGDVFAAAFVCAVVGGSSVVDAAKLATAYSAVVISGHGIDAFEGRTADDFVALANEVNCERG